MKSGVGAIVAIFSMLIGVAVLSVILSQNAQTAKVLQALGSASSGVIGAATRPVTG
jgi:hypothetical protein